jgi:polyphosphate kinase 2 (PPK2 family)
MMTATHTETTPWYVVNADDKARSAQLHFASSELIPYEQVPEKR